jgi:hypothetical protein
VIKLVMRKRKNPGDKPGRIGKNLKPSLYSHAPTLWESNEK